MEIQSLYRRLLGGAFVGFLSRVVGAACGFLLGVLLVRLLAPESLGFYFLVVNLAASLSIFLRCGADIAVVRQVGVARGRHNLDEAAPEIFAYGALLAVTSVILAPLAASILVFLIEIDPNTSASVTAFLIGAIAIARSWEGYFAAVLRALLRLRIGVAVADAPRQLLLLAGFFLAWVALDELDAATALWAFLLSCLIAALVNGVLVAAQAARLPGPLNSAPIGSFRSLLGRGGSSFPMALNTLANSLLPTGTLAVVSAKTGAYEAGLLGIMLQLYFLIGLGLTIANQVLSPPVASLFAARHLDQLEWLLQRIARLAFAICAALAFTVIVFGKPLLTLIYSADYAQLAGPLSLLALSQVFSASVGSPGVVMLMTGHQNALLLITVFSVALAIVVSSLLVTDYKIWGVAIGISMSQVSQNVSMVLFVFLRLRVRTWLSLRPVSAASAELGSVNRRE